MKIDDLDEDMINKILQQIAIHYPFPSDHIRSVFEYTKSFDVTIQTCELAISMGVTSPIHAMQVLLAGVR